MSSRVIRSYSNNIAVNKKAGHTVKTVQGKRNFYPSVYVKL